MRYVRLGRSNLKVSMIGLGAMGMGSPAWREWVGDSARSAPVFVRAIEAGINFIDTCDFYSNGESERIVGKLIAETAKRDEIVLATKGGNPMGKGPNARGYSRKHLFEAVDASLRRLGTDRIDLYQTHIWDPTSDLDELIDALDALVQSGKVLYVGITDMPSWQFAKAFYTQFHRGTARFVSVQNHYNPIWREDERDLIPLCVAEGIGLIPYSPMARGYLSRSAQADAEPSVRFRTDDFARKVYGRPSDDAVAEVVRTVAAERGVSPGQVSMAWTLSRRGVTGVVSGPTRPEHIDEAVAALELRLAPEEIGRIEAAYLPRPYEGHGF
jgi:aryl-alcohol dehydrogenase-like predicted oxidoreductase